MFFCSKVKVAAGRLCQAAPPGSMVTRPELDNSAYLEQSSDTVINGGYLLCDLRQVTFLL